MSKPGVKWDEDNIRETYHPADKDYGHMKIDEPNTPYEPPLEMDHEEDDDDDVPSLNLEGESPIVSNIPVISAEAPEEEFAVEETTEKKHVNFMKKRKEHYNMREAMLRARQLMAEEGDDEEDEEEDEEKNDADEHAKTNAQQQQQQQQQATQSGSQ
ncbi:hypothetical protein PTSG_02501 [Salpingoeca rosetta]|uniref:Protein phosphatase inhibitor 2 n=1 Tax=Salpingoeca rosetta (strain ATCC 50818 / BSB-021) TaxID=946362 RepID=F2U2D6_SALR5|nr:uncharacterized protein PTSG_02501 [Salpingoeca rosetta]EGD81788.1 hypothetical protein PTSG_02501 [Salpingoeca rosetta]|eukprot:XP_004996992.1 hypothetical protein PTSG_02501 [Salpingoeca rosetta]